MGPVNDVYHSGLTGFQQHHPVGSLTPEGIVVAMHKWQVFFLSFLFLVAMVLIK